uniref:BED-type domain-containing protein n=1 Tax=Heligmosomoides polygyrus TaxID=6339 RepID=A0A8L8KSW3_HELPZ
LDIATGNTDCVIPVAEIEHLSGKFVDDTGSDVAECRICSKIYKIPRCRSTSNLLRHLKENHPEELRNANATRTRREKNNNDPKQATLEETLKRKMTKAQKESLDKKLATAVAHGSLPLSIVASPSFSDFVTALNPSYRTPSTKGLKDVMRAQVQEVDDEHRALFATATDVAITIDCWKSKNGNCSLLSVTGHVFSSDFNRRHNVVLDCITLKEKSQTANIIASKIRQSLSRLSISETRLKYVAPDGATVIENVSRDFGAKYIHCCAHVINLIVSKSIATTPANGLIQRIKQVVAKINKSSKTKFEYREYLQEMDLPKKMPCTECPTRWGSTFLMLSDVLNAMSAFDHLMDYLKLSRFEIEEVRVLKKIRNFLEPYYTMTNQVCFKDSTASMYIGVAQILISATESSSSSWSDEKWLRYGRYYDSDSSSESSDTDYDSTDEENSYEENSDAPTLD